MMPKSREVVLELRVKMKPRPMYVVNSASPEPILSAIRVGFTFHRGATSVSFDYFVFEIRDTAFTLPNHIADTVGSVVERRSAWRSERIDFARRIPSTNSRSKSMRYSKQSRT